MLTPIAKNIWSTQHGFVTSGMPCTSRMTVVQLRDGGLWVHSPVPLDATLKAEIDRLGPVRFVVAPNLAHHLFFNDFANHYPDAFRLGAPGLAAKRPDIAGLQTLPLASSPWEPELACLVFEGMPKVNETVWFHSTSGTLILTDICQDWQGPLAWPTKAYAHIMGVRSRFDVPRIVRLLVKDKTAAAASAQAVLRWPVQRVVVAHNSILEHEAQPTLAQAFRHFLA